MKKFSFQKVLQWTYLSQIYFCINICTFGLWKSLLSNLLWHPKQKFWLQESHRKFPQELQGNILFRESQLTLKNKIFSSVLGTLFDFRWLKIFLQVIWLLSRYLNDCPEPGLSSARQIMTLRNVEVKLSLRKRAKDKILFFRANWDSRNFWVFVSFWHTFWLQISLEKSKMLLKCREKIVEIAQT